MPSRIHFTESLLIPSSLIEQKNQLTLEIKLPQSNDLDTKIEAAGLETLEYDKRWGRYRLRLTKDEMKSKADFLKELARNAYERRYAG